MHVPLGQLRRFDLALQDREREGLFNLLDIPVRQWTDKEIFFVRGVTRSLRRATRGGVGYGEVASGLEFDDYPMKIE